MREIARESNESRENGLAEWPEGSRNTQAEQAAYETCRCERGRNEERRPVGTCESYQLSQASRRTPLPHEQCACEVRAYTH